MDSLEKVDNSGTPATEAPANSVKLVEQVRWKRVMQVILDCGVLSVALLGAYLIRFDGHIAEPYWYQLSVYAPLTITMMLLSNWAFGVYRRLWRYTGLTEVMELFCSVLSVTTIFLIVRASGYLVIGGHHMSYGIIFINCILAFLSLSGPRVLRRLAIEHSQRKHWRQPIRRRSLVVGAGDAGQMVLKELSQRSDLGVDVVGLIDDDPSKLRTRIGALTVFGTTKELPSLIESLFIDQVIFFFKQKPASEIRKIVDICRECEVDTRILPGLFELIDGKVSVSQLREVSLEDLLGRAPIEMDNASIAGYLEDRTVLVTGAGGSIGSELCRQIMRFQPSRLILLGKGENSIFSIEQELKARPEPVEIVPVIADIRDIIRMRAIFEKFKPSTVFHAAAHKHVPLMECNVTEAVANNVLGTRVIAELSHLYEVETFVLVSSDK
ncbi:MAG TPA: polysaccharide biosynthesis protein, partial [Candidatus Melainabacteria bacterium]|nr:polysaccharide biosynthesis protein [Candidatus Melainabacteria bacterium]